MMASSRVEDDDAVVDLVRGNASSERSALRRIVASVLVATMCIVAVVMVLKLLKLEQKVETAPRLVVGVEAFDAACTATLHRDVCMQTLLPNYHAHSATPDGLTAILVASAAQGVTQTLAAVLANRGVNRIGFSGERVCHSTLVSSVQQLDASSDALQTQALRTSDRPSFDEIQTRIRAAEEFHTTCIDALVATGALEPHTVDAEQHAAKLLRNALAAVAALSRFGPDLLSWQPVDDVATDESRPSWVSSLEEDISLIDHDPPIDVLVARDGSGQFKSIQVAIDAAVPKLDAKRYVIKIKAGVYNEQVIVPKTARSFMLLGEGAGISIITGNRSVVTTLGMTTFFSPTLIVEGAGFMGKGFTVRNTAAGGEQQQAVAMRVSADMTVFYQCTFDGGQDTLHTHSFRHLYRHCTIAGSDVNRFVLGHGAVATFQSCSMGSLKIRESQLDCSIASASPGGLLIFNNMIDTTC